jgi:hypothetical protein
LLTNSMRNIIGTTEVEPARFEFETLLPFGTCREVCDCLGRSLVSWDGHGTVHILCLNFVDIQFSGGQLRRPNSIWKAVSKEISMLPSHVMKLMTARYPDIEIPPQTVSRPSETVSDGQTVRDHPPSTGTERSGTERSTLYVLPSDEEVQKFAAAWPGEPASGVPPMPAAWVDAWLARILARSGTESFPVQWQRAIVAGWRKDFRSGNVGGEFASSKNPGMWEMTKRLEALKGQRANHPANEQSAAFAGEPTADEEEEYDRLVREIRDLEKQIGGMQPPG